MMKWCFWTRTAIVAACVFLGVGTASAAARVSLSFQTPPSGVDNDFTVLCKIDAQQPTVSTYNLRVGFNGSSCSFVSAQHVAGGSTAGFVSSEQPGGCGPASDTHMEILWTSNADATNVTSLFTVTFKQTAAGNIHMDLADNDVDGIADGSFEPIPHNFENSYLPVSLSGFGLD